MRKIERFVGTGLQRLNQVRLGKEAGSSGPWSTFRGGQLVEGNPDGHFGFFAVLPGEVGDHVDFGFSGRRGFEFSVES